MKRDMEDILLDLIDGDIGMDEAKEELLFLNSVSNSVCECEEPCITTKALKCTGCGNLTDE
tara:strand:+ start:71 stop:253 length:183 start_codon:yes stop_codon:yes gene_type:complete